jgi:hypothetical protein
VRSEVLHTADRLGRVVSDVRAKIHGPPTISPPTSTAVEVSRPFRPGFPIEVDAVAAIG